MPASGDEEKGRKLTRKGVVVVVGKLDRERQTSARVFLRRVLAEVGGGGVRRVKGGVAADELPSPPRSRDRGSAPWD